MVGGVYQGVACKQYVDFVTFHNIVIAWDNNWVAVYYTLNCPRCLKTCSRIHLATLAISGELIVSRYIAESITTDCRRFRLHRPLSTAYKTFLFTVTKAYMVKCPAISCYWFCYVSTHNQFTLVYVLYTSTHVQTIRTWGVGPCMQCIAIVHCYMHSLQWLFLCVNLENLPWQKGRDAADLPRFILMRINELLTGPSVFDTKCLSLPLSSIHHCSDSTLKCSMLLATEVPQTLPIWIVIHRLHKIRHTPFSCCVWLLCQSSLLCLVPSWTCWFTGSTQWVNVENLILQRYVGE